MNSILRTDRQYRPYSQTKEKLYNQSFHNNIFNAQFTIYKVQFNYADDSAAKLYFVNGKL